MKESENILLSFLQEKSRNIETDIDPLERKRTGSYYTHISLTNVMMRELIEQLQSSDKPIEDYKFLEPCVGTGNFVFSYINEIKKLGINKTRAEKLLGNIYVADVNTKALKNYSESLKKLVFSYWDIELDDYYFNSHIGSGLLIDVTANELNYIPISEVFDTQIIERGFDIVVTNPPYKNLKAERSHYSNDKEYNIDKCKYTSISNIVTKKFQYSVNGVLNLYKLFVEEIIDNYAAKDAFISLLLPASILSDKTCTKLRTHILNDMNLISVKIIEEGSGFIDAQQALSTLLIHKGEKTKHIHMTKNYCKRPNESTMLDIADILNDNTGNAIFAISQKEYITLKKLRNFPVVKDLNFIVNLRGELDLTTNKEYITNIDTGYKLLRGKNIEYYKLKDEYSCEYVLQEFIASTKKSCYIQHDRIICQQIANMHKDRRVTFALAPHNYVLGNSCNFIYVMENNYGIDIYSILGLFNTKIINWFFKLTSSNNHVNNYEIDCFPVPIESKYLCDISFLVREFLSSGDVNIIEKIEMLARKAYNLDVENNNNILAQNDIVVEYIENISKLIVGLSYEDAKNILMEQTTIDKRFNGLSKFEIEVVRGITDKYRNLYNGFILNHTTFKLSALDLEMIKAVPQGGNWKDIPIETIEKSKRLKRITQTGGRTTLYGRIDYSKPSYTITTYFNRPGNGTYIHPSCERVLSIREAARFQTFKDDYYFFGNKTQLLKQVGNAIPTILAYQIARQIKNKTGCCRSIDLFCGAGGMTVGFKAAGINSLLSNDIEESVCVTLKINNPEIPVLCGDITKNDIKDLIEKAAKEGRADIICGGPPCQGFSMAGFRSDDDPRNQLFREFIDIVKRVNPKIIVFENVEGLLSYQRGKTYQEIHTLFSKLGYKTEGRTLMASDYAVPQKRKRVIIICTREDINVFPSELFPPPITRNERSQVTAKETIYDLDDVNCEETAKYTSTYTSDIIRFFKGKISYEDYLFSRTNSDDELQNNGLIVGIDGQLALNII